MQALLSLLIVAIAADAHVEGRYPEATQIFHCDFGESADKNFDLWPDGWTRRRGRGFPQYVKVEIRPGPTPVGPRSLGIDLDGAGAVAYSPAVPVDWLHGFVLEGLVKTEGLRHSQAWLSLAFLDQKRQHLETFTSEKVGDSHGWKRLRLGPVSPSSSAARLAMIGLHLEPGAQVELKGSARFADIWLGRLPRIRMTTTVPHHVFRRGEPVAITYAAAGFTEKDATVEFQLLDPLGKGIAQEQKALQIRQSKATPLEEHKADELAGVVGTAEWRPPIPGPGYYRVQASIKRQAQLAHCRELSLAVIEPYTSLPGNEFGWTLAQADKPLPLAVLGPLLIQAGIGRVKLPLWHGPQMTDAQWESLAVFNERLTGQGITVIGVLKDPPPEVRRHLDDSRAPTAAEIFTADPKTWYPSLEPVLVRLAGQVRWWQLGDDRDASFVGYPGVGAKLAEIKAQMSQAAYDLNLALGWKWMSQRPEAPQGKSLWRALSLSANPPLTARELASYLAAVKQAGVERWVVLEPLPRSRFDFETRLADLINQMTTCKVHGAEAAFIAEPFSAERGLMNDDGTAGELLLPWRTTAMMLAGATYVGAVELPGASQNLVFARGGQAVMVLWNRRPGREVVFFSDDVRQTDLWGRTSTPAKQDGAQAIEVGPLPVFLTGLDEAITRWRMDSKFERERIPSVMGMRNKNSLRWTNHFPRGVSGTAQIVAPEGWSVEPRQIAFTLGQGQAMVKPFEITLPLDARCGRHAVYVDFTIQAERIYRFRVYRHIDVGLGDVYVELSTLLTAEGELEVHQRFVNETDQPVTFACELFAPERQRQKSQITGLARGRDLKIYRLPGGKQLVGKTLWFRADEVGGPRVLNYRFTAEP